LWRTKAGKRGQKDQIARNGWGPIKAVKGCDIVCKPCPKRPFYG
jgi:hypothetical protein